MKIQAVFFFAFLSAPCSGNIRPVTARPSIYTGATGGNGTFTCRYPVHYNTKFLCKNDCKGQNILVQTDADVAANGRFSIQYKKEEAVKSVSTLTVTMTDLKKSDAGRYTSGLGWPDYPRSRCDVQVRVTDAPVHGNSGFAYTYVEGEAITHGCSSDPLPGGWKFLCRGNCVKEEDILVETNSNAAQRGRFSLEYSERSLFGLEVAISNMTRSDTGWYRCGYGRALTSGSYNAFPLIVIADPTSTESPALTTEKTSADPSSTESPPLTTMKTSADPRSTESPPPMTEKTSADPRPTESPPLTTEKTSADPRSIESPPSTTEKTSVGTFFKGFFLPLVICVSAAGVLLLTILILILYIQKKTRSNNLI